MMSDDPFKVVVEEEVTVIKFQTGERGKAGLDSTVPGPPGAAGADSTVPGPQGIPGADGQDGADSTIPGPPGEPGTIVLVSETPPDDPQQGDLWVQTVPL